METRRMCRLFRKLCNLAIFAALLTAAALPAEAREDAERTAIDQYFAAMEAYRKGKADEAVRTLRGLLKAFQTEDLPKGVFMTHLSLAEILVSRGEYDKALEELRRAEDKKARERDIRGEALVLYRMAQLERARSDFDKAAEYLQEALSNLRAVEDRRLLAAIDLERARIMIVRGEYEKARPLLNESLERFTTFRDTARYTEALISLAHIARLTDDYTTAAEYLNKAEKAAEASGREVLPAVAAAERALLEDARGNTAQAEKTLKASLETLKKAGAARLEAHYTIFLGDLMLERSRPEDAHKVLSRSSEVLTKFEAGLDLARCRTAQGRVFLSLGNLNKAAASLEQAVDALESYKAAHDEMEARVALAHVQSIQGLFLAARDNLANAGRIADKLDTVHARGRVALVSGIAARLDDDHPAAYRSFSRALELFAKVGDRRRQVNCLLHRAVSMISLGFLDRAEEDADRVREITAGGEDLVVRAQLLMLKGRIAAARGNEAAALKEYDAAAGVLDKFERPVTSTGVLILKAECEERVRNIMSADRLWRQVEARFESMGSPGGVVRAREARVGLALDIGAGETARAIVRQRLAGDIEPRVPYIRLAQAYGTYPGYGGGYSQQYRRPNYERSAPRQIRGPDSAVLNARITALKAEIALAAGDTGAAQEEAEGALNAVKSVKDDRTIDRFERLLGRVLMEKGAYVDALKAFKLGGITEGPRLLHAEAMAAAQEGKRDEALSKLRRLVHDLKSRELREGLWNVRPLEMRRRERIYQDYLEVLGPKDAGAAPSDAVNEAWKAARTLKMRRFLYARAAVGADVFPGVSAESIAKLRSLQFDARNKAKRERAVAAIPALKTSNVSEENNGKMSAKNATGHRSPAVVERMAEEKARPSGAQTAPVEPAAKIDAALEEIGKTSPVFVRLIKGEPPKVERVRQLLASDEGYLSLVVTRTGVYSFWVDAASPPAFAKCGAAADMRKQAAVVVKGIDSPYYYKVSRSANTLWKGLFGAYEERVGKADRLTIEVDGFLTLFPFEALVPGEWPTSYQDQQQAPLMLDSTPIVRTSSAFRFTAARSASEKGKADSLAVFADPVLPSSKGESGNEGGVGMLSRWADDLSRIESAARSNRSDAADIAGIFGRRGKLLTGDRATAQAFLGDETKDASCIHAACPLLLPELPAGRLNQPVFVFSPVSKDPGSAFCGVDRMSAARLDAGLIALPDATCSAGSDYRSVFLLLETFGTVGLRRVLLPLWAADRQGAAEQAEFITVFYSSLRENSDVTAALKKARGGVTVDSSRKNRCNPARWALF